MRFGREIVCANHLIADLEEEIMKRILFVIITISLCLAIFPGCSNNKYDSEWIVGKDSSEVRERYGEFDCTYMPISEDGLYRSRCGYTIKEPKVGFLGTSPEVLFFISFDENGIAVECEEGYRPGG